MRMRWEVPLAATVRVPYTELKAKQLQFGITSPTVSTKDMQHTLRLHGIIKLLTKEGIID